MHDDTSPLINFPHKPQPPRILAINYEHDQHPLWPHTNTHVPGTRRPASRQAREARAVLEALNARITARQEDEALEGFLPGVDDVADWQREGLDR